MAGQQHGQPAYCVVWIAVRANWAAALEQRPPLLPLHMRLPLKIVTMGVGTSYRAEHDAVG